MDLDKALSFYKKRFADASGFTFVIVGNVDLAKTKTLAETYLGSLPAGGHKEAWHDINVTRPNGVAKKLVTQGTEPKSRVCQQLVNDAFSVSLEYWNPLLLCRLPGAALPACFATGPFHHRGFFFQRPARCAPACCGRDR